MFYISNFKDTYRLNTIIILINYKIATRLYQLYLLFPTAITICFFNQSVKHAAVCMKISVVILEQCGRYN